MHKHKKNSRRPTDAGRASSWFPVRAATVLLSGVRRPPAIATPLSLLLILLVLMISACASKQTPPSCASSRIEINSEGQQVTVIIALSSIVPGGIVGHAGIAVENQYWDYGPKRSKHLQPFKSIRSEAGPWWDDPDQQWANDRTLSEIYADMPDKVHPVGSLIAVIQVRVTDEQADAIARFWHDTYDRLRKGEDTYRLTARQCSSMVAWSLLVGLSDEPPACDRLPSELRRFTPTDLYEALSDSLVHTAGPSKGQPADITLWQLDVDGFDLWQRPSGYDRLPLPELPRIRLAFERLKHAPADLFH